MGLEDARYARDIAYPFRYDENCDLALDENEKVIEQSLILLIFTRKGSIILWRVFGSDVASSIFDPLDDAMELAVDTSIREAVESFEHRVILNRDIVLDEIADESSLLIILPVTIKNSAQKYYARIHYPRPGMRVV